MGIRVFNINRGYGYRAEVKNKECEDVGYHAYPVVRCHFFEDEFNHTCRFRLYQWFARLFCNINSSLACGVVSLPCGLSIVL